MNLTDLSQEIHKNNVDKGFYDTPTSVAERIALIHSEVSEALEADRHERYAHKKSFFSRNFAESGNYKANFEENIKDTFEDELADALIRIMDLAAHKGIDIDFHVRAKIEYNKLRPYKHGKKY